MGDLQVRVGSVGLHDTKRYRGLSDNKHDSDKSAQNKRGIPNP